MRNLLLSATLILVASLVATAQNGLGSNDPKAKVILDAVSAKFKSFKAVEAKFTLKVENNAGKVLGNKAGTVFMKGTRYRVSVTGQEIFCDGRDISTYDKSVNEVTITRIDPSANSITPQKMFTNFYDKDFLYKLNGDAKVNGKAAQEIELTPVDKSKPFFKVLLYVDKATSTIVSTRVFEKAGNKYTYSVVKMNPAANVPDSTFVFDAKKFPGVEVTDLR